MHCSYICCLVLYIGSALAVLTKGEAPRYIIAPAAVQFQQQQLHFTNQQSLPVNDNNFEVSPVHPTSPATSPHFLTHYRYAAPAVTTTIRPPITAVTSTIVPTVQAASNQTLNPGYIYSAPTSAGYNHHAYYAPYNQPNYPTAALTAHSDADVEHASWNITPNYYVSQSAATNSEKNSQAASNFYAAREATHKSEVAQETQSTQREQRERKEEPTSQQVISVDVDQTQPPLTPYQRIFREFADYLLWKREQAKQQQQQQQIQKSQEEQALSSAPTNGDFSGTPNQFEFTAPSAGATQISSGTHEVPQLSPTVNLPQTTDKPLGDGQTLQRPIVVAGVGHAPSENHVAYLSKPPESWGLPPYNAGQTETADGQLQAIFSEQGTQGPLSGGLNRDQCGGSEHAPYQEGDSAPGSVGGGPKSEPFDWREQQLVLEEKNRQQQQQLLQQQQELLTQQHQQQLSLQQLQEKQQQLLQQQKQHQQQLSLQQLQEKQQQQLIQQQQNQHQQLLLQQQQNLQPEQQHQLQDKQHQQHLAQQQLQNEQQQVSLQNLQQKLQEAQQQQSVQQQQQISLQQKQQLEPQQEHKLQQLSQQQLQQGQIQLNEVQQQHLLQQKQKPQLSLQMLQQKLQQQQPPQHKQQPKLSLQKLQQKLQEVQKQKTLEQQKQQQQFHIQQKYPTQQNYLLQQQQQEQKQQQGQQYPQHPHYHTHQQQLQQTHADLFPTPTQQPPTRLGDEWHAQKIQWPLSSALYEPQLQQQQPHQGHSLQQTTIHNFVNEANQEGEAPPQPMQHAGGVFAQSAVGNDLLHQQHRQLAAQQQQPAGNTHLLRQTLEATTPAAIFQGSHLTSPKAQPAQKNSHSNVNFNLDATLIRRPHITYGVPL